MRRVFPLAIALVLVTTAAHAQMVPWERTSVAAPSPDGPLESARRAAHALATKDCRALVDLLPPPWVKEVDAVVQERVRRMDPELFARLAAVLEDLVGELQKRRGKLVEGRQQWGIYTAEEVEKLIGQLVDFWLTLERTGLDKRSGWLSFSLVSFAQQAAPSLLELLLLSVGTTQRSGVEAGLKILDGATFQRRGMRVDPQFGDVVQVRILLAGESVDDELVQVAGRWVTLEMAEDMPAWFAKMKAGHEEWSREQSSGKSERLQKVQALEKAVAIYKERGNLEPVLKILGGESGEDEPSPGQKK